MKMNTFFGLKDKNTLQFCLSNQYKQQRTTMVEKQKSLM